MLSLICSLVTPGWSNFFLRFWGLWASGLGCLLLMIFLIVLDPFVLFVIKSSVLLRVNFFLGQFEFDNTIVFCVVANKMGDVCL